MASPLDMRSLMREEFARHRTNETKSNGDNQASSTHRNESGTQKKQEYTHAQYRLPQRHRLSSLSPSSSEAATSPWKTLRINQFPDAHPFYSGCALPATLAYIPEFLSKEEERNVVNCIHGETYVDKWVHLKHRRLQNWGGSPQPEGLTEQETLPPWLDSVVDPLEQIGLFSSDVRPNHVLINQYLPGEGILPHTDGPIYHPSVAILSFHNPTIFHFHLKRDLDISEECPVSKFSLLIQPRSLLIFSDALYEHYLHGIEDTIEETIPEYCIIPADSSEKIGGVLYHDLRESATIRHVPFCHTNQIS